MGAMRVPRPAAGMITTTFMAGCKYTAQAGVVQICRSLPSRRSRDSHRQQVGERLSPHEIFACSQCGLCARFALDSCGWNGCRRWRRASRRHPTEEAGTGAAGREYAPRSSHLPKIILPAVVCSTEVTETSMVLPIILRALSTTTMVPSSR